MKTFVLGGDGFCGWPLALRLSDCGHDVTIVDNGSRRQIDAHLGTGSLTPIAQLQERVAAWRDISGRAINVAEIDLASGFRQFRSLLVEERPAALVHLAEQRAVPYSMGPASQRRYTFSNNLRATTNVLIALKDSGLDAHLVHIGSTGIYGYETLGYCVPEGYIRAHLHADGSPSKTLDILHPANPLSIYHLTKAQDQLALAFFAKHEGIRVTELVQGTVWGTQTAETARDERLINRFDYDATYGTVLNRFALQAALGYPLTVYGGGGQTRAFIHIGDVMRCVQIALDNPPTRGERMQVFNQIAETMRVRDIANLARQVWPGVTVDALDNPRDEPASNEFALSNEGFRSLGLTPRLIKEGLLAEIRDVAARYAHRADRSVIAPAGSARKRRAPRELRREVAAPQGMQ
ncbi:MAG: NAD-dependent epimerase/dehydratase family protein [Vitreimonas sp.]